MSQNSISRRRFLFNSLLTTGGVLLAPNIISCSNDYEVYDIPSTYTNDSFLYGVASFDPSHDQVIIWTKYESSKKEAKIFWQVAYDSSFKNVVRSGEAIVDFTTDYTLAVEIQNLEPNSKLFYRFFSVEDNSVSVVGETITLPLNADEIKLAVCSCANYQAGLFNVYGAMANSNADIIVHLGDYIYEYGEGEYGTNEYTVSLGRNHKPSTELFTLYDYRERYKQYRSDKNLQLAHQKKPFICVWDDHEIANDTFKDGAENHQVNEGSFTERKEAAIRAYSEYLPVKTSDKNIIYRSFNIGNLVNLIMLDTRVIGRDQQLNYANYYDASGNFNAGAFQNDWLNPNRSILGSTQRNWLISELNNSTTTWQVLGQQVLMGKMMLPAEMLGTLSTVEAEVSATGSASPSTMAYFQQQITELVTIKLKMANGIPVTAEEQTRISTVLPYNLDAWDGYPIEREVLYANLSGKKVISLAGDTHNAWYNKLSDSSNNIVGREFATSSVTSPGLENYLGIDPSTINSFEDAMQILVNDLDYLNAVDRGFLEIRFTPSSADAEWKFVSSVFSDGFFISTDKTENYSA